MKQFSTLNFIVNSLSIIAIVVLQGCGSEPNHENLIDYQRPDGVGIDPSNILGVWSGDYEAGSKKDLAISKEGDPVYEKVGIRIEKTQMRIHLRCVYGNLRRDAWGEVPISINEKDGSITMRATTVVRALPAMASVPCSFSTIKDATTPYLIDSQGTLNLNDHFGVFLEKRGDR